MLQIIKDHLRRLHRVDRDFRSFISRKWNLDPSLPEHEVILSLACSIFNHLFARERSKCTGPENVTKLRDGSGAAFARTDRRTQVSPVLTRSAARLNLIIQICSPRRGARNIFHWVLVLFSHPCFASISLFSSFTHAYAYYPLHTFLHFPRVPRGDGGSRAAAFKRGILVPVKRLFVA